MLTQTHRQTDREYLRCTEILSDLITRQNYFVQRILSKNRKFANTPGYVFGAASYVESERLRNNANLSGYRGKKDSDEEGQISYTLTNPFTVFDKVPNTPKYWQNVRYEMMAKMENMGPFHWFFTLSCGDMRWCANFRRYFEENKFELNVDKEGVVWVRGNIQEGKELRKGWEEDFNEKGKPIMKRTWDDLKESDEFKTEVSAHKEIKNDVLLATRNFQHRVEMFRKEIMFGSNNPMKIRHITYRVEFQGRGAGHIHGVLWVDLEEINKDMKEELEAKLNKIVIDMIIDGEDEEKINIDTILIDAYDKLRKNEKLNMAEGRALEIFADKFCTCSLNSKEVGEKVAKIAKLVNEHGHSKSCKKTHPKCRWRFPKFPLPKTTFIDANREVPEEEKHKPEYIESTLKRVKNVLIEDRNGKEEISQKVLDIMQELPRNEHHTINDRILRILEEASKDGEGKIEFNIYRRAVEQQPDKSQRCKILLRRDIDEIFINNYNPEWLEAWDSNIDVSLVSDFYGAITYITDYWTKDSSGLTDVLTSAVKQLSKDDEMKKKCQELANTFISHRQIGEAEAYYKLFPHMNLTYSSVATTYIPTDIYAERRRFLQKQDPEAKTGFTVKDKKGRFLEKTDMISKYERRMVVLKNNNQEGEDEEEETYEQIEKARQAAEAVEKLTYCQFAKMYETSWEGETFKEHGGLSTKDKFNFVMVGDDEDTGKSNENKTKEDQNGGGDLNRDTNVKENQYIKEPLELPLKLQLKDPMPGEPPFLRRRSFPKAIRFFKQKLETDPHKFYLQHLLLFWPFRDEKSLSPENPEECKTLYLTNETEIDRVKMKVMPFMESVRLARSTYEENKENEEPTLEEVAAMLDPEKEQEIIDGEEEEEEEHPEYLHLDPDQVKETESYEKLKSRKVFRSIEIPSIQDRLDEARRLDRMQRHVLSVGLKYAKGLVKARRKQNNVPTPPRMIVHGGAGSGKSCVIKPLAEWMQDILQQEGDDPDCPQVVLTSYTGAAAANINGQTIHSMFKLKFGTKFMSLSDQQRDMTRSQFRRLKTVIIDEISLVSADIFYILDQKLREIMQVNKPFGDLAIFIFGDLFQLQPPQGVYPFSEPSHREHSVVYQLNNLWQTFEVVNLEENHRQGEDKIYADLLNRVRTGSFTDEDIELLKTRERDINDPEVKKQGDALHVYSTNAKVNARNQTTLNEMEGELLEIQSENRHKMLKNFKPKVDNAGCVQNTSLQAVLKLKRGAQVVLTFNVDTVDGLTNGARGVLLDVEKEKTKEGKIKVKRLIVKFHNAKHGREHRKTNPCHKYPHGTYINPIWWTYQLGASQAEVYQFPVKMAAAITSHKIQVTCIAIMLCPKLNKYSFQGQTVAKPNNLFISTDGWIKAGMVYVMLSRVCCLLQLVILGKLNPDKIKADPKVITEARRMEEVSVNKNPTRWNSNSVKGVRISSTNVRSLRKHIEDVRKDPVLLRSDVICIEETWLEPKEDENVYEIEGYTTHLNSQGRGKGIAIYMKKNKFRHVMDFRSPYMQITKVTSERIDVISVYRSQEEPFLSLKNQVESLIDPNKTTLVVGDFNFCYKTSQNEYSSFMSKSKFNQLVEAATHIEGGLLDHAYFKCVGDEREATLELCSNYYSDHDTVTVFIP